MNDHRSASEPPSREPLRAALAWTGAGLFAGSLVFAVVGLALTFEPVAALTGTERVADIPAHATTSWLLLGLIAAAGLVVQRPLLPRSGVSTGGEGTSPSALGIGRTLVAVGAAVLALLAVRHFPRDALIPASVHAHSFTETGVLIWSCVVLLAAAGLLSAGAGHARGRRSRPLLPVTSAGAGVVAVVLVAGLAASVTHPRVIHTVVAGDLGEPPSVPASVGAEGWVWSPPPGVRVERVEAGPRGPILVLPDGVIALDGPSGQELWTYREPHGEGVAARLLDDVLFLTRDSGNISMTGTVLDPATGGIIPGEPHLEELVAYARSTTLHEYRDDAGTRGIEARAFDRTATGTGGTRWTFVPQGEGLYCELQRDVWPTTDPGTGDGLVVVAHACADAREYGERTLAPAPPLAPADGSEGILAHGESLDSAVATVAALDLASGEEVWRHEHPVRRSWGRFDLGPVEGAALSEGEARALRFGADGELFLLDPRTGKPLGHPEEARDPRGRFGPGVDRVLRADTAGTVLALKGRYPGTARAVEVLTADPGGEVTARVTMDVAGEPAPELLDQAVVLDDALLIPYVDREADERGVHSFALAAGGLGGERVEIGPSAKDVPGEHRLVAVPGAVVSHGSGAADVHGLVP
ncbi:hypothetical protein [Nocardiopsis prasina]|uniref:hypothetical protein n=1 Tax=Nocardiopsis prasina TaxID=2015 RepID=UPI000344CCD9|nr:hypothetical protein [Nocardiopsis prasina]